jgi:hypothetical protein
MGPTAARYARDRRPPWHRPDDGPVIEYTLPRQGPCPAAAGGPLLATDHDRRSRVRHRPPSWPRSPTSAGSSRGCWTSSRSTSAVLGWCCAPTVPRWSSRRSTPCCWPTSGHPPADVRLLHQAAVAGDLDPDQLSFTRKLRVVRRQITDQEAFPPERLVCALRRTIAEIRRLIITRRQRADPRVVKRKCPTSASNAPPTGHGPSPPSRSSRQSSSSMPPNPLPNDEPQPPPSRPLPPSALDAAVLRLVGTDHDGAPGPASPAPRRRHRFIEALETVVERRPGQDAPTGLRTAHIGENPGDTPNVQANGGGNGPVPAA